MKRVFRKQLLRTEPADTTPKLVHRRIAREVLPKLQFLLRTPYSEVILEGQAGGE